MELSGRHAYGPRVTILCDNKDPTEEQTVTRPIYMAASVGHYTEQQRMHTTEMEMLGIRWIQDKTRKDRIRNKKFRSDAIVKPITTYDMSHRNAFHGMAILMRRDDKNAAKAGTTIKVGGKRPRGRPRLRWMDRVRSDVGEETSRKAHTEVDGQSAK